MGQSASTEATGRRNRDVVLPPIARSLLEGHSTIEQAIIDAYEQGLHFGFELGASNPDMPNPWSRKT